MDTNVYSSDHLYLAAYLVCSGHDVVGTKIQGSRVSFIFQQSPELLVDIAGYLADGVIPARHFSFELLKLKKMINGGQNVKRVGKSENNNNGNEFNPST